MTALAQIDGEGRSGGGVLKLEGAPVGAAGARAASRVALEGRAALYFPSCRTLEKSGGLGVGGGVGLD